jgi:hypothetical protein
VAIEIDGQDSEIALLEAIKLVNEVARTGKVSLNLSQLTALRQLPPLSGVSNLHHLDLHNTLVADLSELRHLTSIRQLNLSNTRINSLSQISNLKTLQVLTARSINIKEISPLSDLVELIGLNLKDTYVRDLSPLSNLTKMRSLNLIKVPVSDLSPLRGLVEMRVIILRDTRVHDLEPISALPLEQLDISGTRVKDLSSIAKNVSLIAAAKRSPEGGLKFNRCSIDDPILMKLAAVPNPDCTLLTFAHLNSKSSDQISKRENVDDYGKDLVLPTQGVGPHFAIKDGIIDFAPPLDIDIDGNHVERLKQLYPLICDAIAELVSSLQSGNIPHSRILDAAKKYQMALGDELTAAQFAQLFGYGLRLQNAAEATKRKVSAQELPELTDHQLESLETLLSLHGPFILSSAEGNALIEASDKYDLSKTQQLKMKKAAIELAELLKGSKNVIKKEVAEHLVESTNEFGEGPTPDRTAEYARSVTSNIAVVLVGAAIIGGFSYGLLTAPFTSTMFIAISSVIGSEAVKKSKAGKLAGEPLVELIDRSTIDFVLKHERVLRDLAGDSKKLVWIHNTLNWIHQKSKKNN